MILEGFGVEDLSGLGVAGMVPLPGVTVLFGKNGAGKTRLIEYLDSLLTPMAEYRGRQDPGNPIWAYGHLYVRPDLSRVGPDSRWLSQLAIQRAYDQEDSHSEVDPQVLVDLDWNTGLLTQLPFALCAGLPDPQKAWGESFFKVLLLSALLSYQNFESGFIGLLIEDSHPQIDALRSQADVIVNGNAGVPPAPHGSLAELAARRLLNSQGRYIHVLRLIEFPTDQDAYQRLRAMHPRVAWIEDFSADLAAELAEVIPPPLWIPGVEPGTLRVTQEASDALAALEHRTNDLAPGFVRREGRIVLSAATPTAGRAAEIAVRFCLADTDVQIDYRQLGAGLRRWVGATLRIACRAMTPRPFLDTHLMNAIEPALVLLVDEPEMHLGHIRNR